MIHNSKDNKEIAAIVRIGTCFTVYKNGVAIVTFGYPRPLKNAKEFCDRRGWGYKVLKGRGKKVFINLLLESIKVQK